MSDWKYSKIRYSTINMMHGGIVWCVKVRQWGSLNDSSFYPCKISTLQSQIFFPRLTNLQLSAPITLLFLFHDVIMLDREWINVQPHPEIQDETLMKIGLSFHPNQVQSLLCNSTDQRQENELTLRRFQVTKTIVWGKQPQTSYALHFLHIYFYLIFRVILATFSE